MTRAKERLVIAGTRGKNKIPDGCWYQLVEDALKSDCAAEPADTGDGDVWRYRKGPPGPKPREEKAADKSKPVPLPAWLTASRWSETSAPATVTPSSAEDDDTRPPASGGRAAALLRGTLTHRLLQSLPDIPAERRARAAQDYLARAGGTLTAEERAMIAEQVMRVLEHPGFHELFAPGSRAEVPIVGRIVLNGEPVRVSGQIDRLAVTESAVLIADFKTNRPAPRRIEDVPRTLRPPARALSRRAAKVVPGKTPARRAHLDRSH